MKREIKFRYWNGNEKKMYQQPENGWSSFPIIPNDESELFLQYTGLKDKNGKEIYEGDIVRVGEMEDLENDTDATIHKVKWFGDEGYPSFDFEGWGGEVNGMSEVSQGIDYYCEVIGNIYENPDLITNN